LERGGGGDLIRVVRTDTGFQAGAFGGAYRSVDIGELAAVFGVVEQRPLRAGLGDGLREGAAGEAAVAVRRNMLGPRFDAGVGDGLEVGACGETAIRTPASSATSRAAVATSIGSHGYAFRFTKMNILHRLSPG